ncbi:MAG: hypothetical protein FFODKBPE_00369 [Candidatus Argoarchaeum ethanivorans]|uniref:Uncharacterized protein n=1 Tax=Candidatus Argoarchaeum ethanivorans TaxID=2608793 RepID=A0A811TAJ7_9EURY|nr:MAG: hypothetical protein FFODKBPE_00369 [Candidatus Argoarchaeum ethanivorans]
MVFYSMIEYHKKSCVTRNHHIVIKYDNKHDNKRDNITAHNVKLAIIPDVQESINATMFSCY